MVKIYFNNRDLSSAEYMAGNHLKEVFLNTLPKEADGFISIVPNVYLLGYKVKDIDLVVFGKLINCFVEIDNLSIEVKSFITTIELKSHSITSIEFTGTNFLVQYANKHAHNVTNQSDAQKTSLVSFLRDNNFSDVFVTNSIFFNRIFQSEFRKLITKNLSFKSNVFCGDFTFEDFIKSIMYQNEENYKNEKRFNSIDNFNSLDNEKSNRLIYLLNSVFIETHRYIGEFTRKKIESITYSVLNSELSTENIVRGQPGTGKTHYLLVKALHLTENDNKRVILLTYNNILANDIKRIFSLTKFKDSYNDFGFKIDTIHKFVFNICEIFKILEPNRDFIINYTDYVIELTEYFKSGIINKNEILTNFTDYYYDLLWDYIFIDEAQDCTFEEKILFEQIVGKDNLVLSEGTNQNVRKNAQNKPLKINASVKRLKQLLRQKENILYFNKYLLEQLNYDFELNNYKRYSGGEVYIFEDNFINVNIYEKLVENIKQFNCSNYDLMFLVPPNLVNAKDGFILKDEFSRNNIDLWDGTISSLRNTVAPNEVHRVFQYDSSRGIEAWITCAINLDDFYEYKWNQFNMDYYDTSLLSSFEEQRNHYVNNWMMIILTRSIDTIVITLKNKNSRIASLLQLISKKNDFIHYFRGSSNE